MVGTGKKTGRPVRQNIGGRVWEKKSAGEELSPSTAGKKGREEAP